MRDRRKLRKPGESLTLGGTEYRLEQVEGFGGSAAVYRASYADQLNKGYRHYVFIKELFPFHAKGDIYRNEAGEICCRGDGSELMEQARRNFYRGNEANLRLLEQNPEKVSGNLNSFQAYGTFYSVLAVHGGNDLESVLRDRQEVWTLKETSEVILKILEATECFHRNKILHLDISPDNILLVEEQALLIDYNSVWLMDEEETKQIFSQKDGYTAPEIRLREQRNIGPASDIYSVCAVWYHMLTGRRLSDEEVIGNHLRKNLSPDLRIFRDEPVTAVQKTMQTIAKGLHILSGRRWQSTDQMKEAVEEVLRRIEGKGISHSALWECSRREQKRYRQGEESCLDRDIRIEDGNIYPGKVCEESLKKGGHILLRGSAGMGKTRFLTEIWKKSVEQYHPSEPVAVYIPLNDYQTAGKEPFYIRKHLVRQLCFPGQSWHLEEMVQELDRQLEKPDGWRLILLLDGLNEAGNTRNLLLKEIETMGKKSSVGILVTDRTDGMKAYRFCDFQSAELLPLTEQVVERELLKDGLRPVPQMGKLLCNPMMLSLYQKTIIMSEKSGQRSEVPDQMMDVKHLAGSYLKNLCVLQQNADAGNETEQLRHRYLLDHFLPEIARKLKQKKKTMLSRQELYRLAEESYRKLGKKDFLQAFPEYFGKSRFMLDGISAATEWFDYAVTEQMEERLNLLERSEEGNYCLVYDIFLEYLADQASENHRKLGRCQRELLRKKAAAVLLLLLVLSGTGAFLWTRQEPYRLSQQEQYQLKEVLFQTGRNLGALGVQIDIQQKILKSAAAKEVLEGDEAAMEKFLDELAERRQQADQYIYERTSNKRALDELEKSGVDVPIRLLENLLDRTYEMDMIMEGGLDHLEECMKKDGLSYTAREEVVTFYQKYLEACVEVTYRELHLILIQLDEESASELLKMVSEAAVIKDYIRTYSDGETDVGTLELKLEKTREYMKNCMDGMKQRNYKINITDWQ